MGSEEKSEGGQTADSTSTSIYRASSATLQQDKLRENRGRFVGNVPSVGSRRTGGGPGCCTQ